MFVWYHKHGHKLSKLFDSRATVYLLKYFKLMKRGELKCVPVMVRKFDVGTNKWPRFVC